MPLAIAGEGPDEVAAARPGGPLRAEMRFLGQLDAGGLADDPRARPRSRSCPRAGTSPIPTRSPSRWRRGCRSSPPRSAGCRRWSARTPRVPPDDVDRLGGGDERALGRRRAAPAPRRGGAGPGPRALRRRRLLRAADGLLPRRARRRRGAHDAAADQRRDPDPRAARGPIRAHRLRGRAAADRRDGRRRRARLRLPHLGPRADGEPPRPRAGRGAERRDAQPARRHAGGLGAQPARRGQGAARPRLRPDPDGDGLRARRGDRHPGLPLRGTRRARRCGS